MEKKHLTLQDRQCIELMLNEKKTFTEIAFVLDKSKSTISREVKGHIKSIKVGGQGLNYNNCKIRYGCQKTWVCGICKSPKKFKICRRCALCNFHCPQSGDLEFNLHPGSIRHLAGWQI